MALRSYIRILVGRRLGAPGFNWFLASTLTSALGRNAYAVACAWILVASGDGTVSVAAFFAIVSLTELLASPAAGWISDRLDRRRVYMAAETVRCLSAALMVFADSAWMICGSAVIFSCCDRVALTASQAMIPIVGKHLAPSTSNSVAFFTMQVGGLIAAAVAGVLLHIASASTVFALISVAFAMSVGAMWSVAADNGSSSKAPSQDKGKPQPNVALLQLGAMYAILYGGGLLVSIMGPSFIFDELSGNAVDFGILESAWSAGSIIGAILLIPLARFSRRSYLLIIILVMMALLFASVKASVLPWSFLIFAALGAVYNFGRVVVEVTLQAIAPHAMLGRAKGLFHCAGVSVGLIVFGFVSLSADRLSPSTVFLAFALVMLVAAIVLVAFRVRNADWMDQHRSTK